MNRKTFYPSWHKKFSPRNPELIKKMREFEQIEFLKDKEKKINLREQRLKDYNTIDDKWYYFTWDDFQDYLVNVDFDISKCYIPNIIAREKQEEENKRKIIEEQNKLELEYLNDYHEDDYDNYFYENEAFISDNESKIEEIIYYSSSEDEW